MSSSLQEQLIQAGLADPDSARKKGGRKKAAKKKRGKPQQRGRDRGAGRPGAGASAPAEAGGGEAAPAKRQPTAAERADQVRQLVRAHRIDRTYAAVPYRFTRGSRIREIAVTASQQGRIARGELGIVTDGERLELVPAKVARQVRGIDRDCLVVLNTGGEDADEAEHPVPDDLMW